MFDYRGSPGGLGWRPTTLTSAQVYTLIHICLRLVYRISLGRAPCEAI